MKTSSKCKSEYVGKNAMKNLANVMSEMLGRMQWRHIAKVSQKC